jgi:RNA-directed DNA polymerase
VVVNGPEGDLLDWDAVDWRQVEEDVRRLRQRGLRGITGRGPEEGPQPAEADAPFPGQRAAERAPGDGAERRSETAGVDGKTVLLSREKANTTYLEVRALHEALICCF